MKFTIAAVAAVTVGLAGFTACMPHTEPATGPAHRIEEDDPRWDCATMGNLRCAEVPDVR